MEAIRDNPRRLILFGLVLLVLICLIGYLVFNIFFGNNDQIARSPTPATTQTSGTIEPLVTVTPAEPTATPTHVLLDTPTAAALSSEQTATPTPTAAQPTATPTKQAAAVAPAVSSSVPKPGEIKNLLKNGDFEQGFDQGGVALQWVPFKNDKVQAIYGRETFPYVESGSSAQRITVLGAGDYNRYAGIYQQIEVVPGQVYKLTLHGQIRTGRGDVNQSSFGYRMQYALSEAGFKNWQNVPETGWVELPWDEQLIDATVTKFYSYTTTIEPESAKITLFVRTWNKWPDPGEVQYTFDSFSLVGPAAVTAPVLTSAGATTTTTTAGEPIIDKGLPTTGAGDEDSFMRDGRFWGGMLILLLLAAGAVYRAKWGY